MGLGHTMKRCETYKRLIKLSSGISSWKSALNWARKDTIADGSKVMLGKRMRFE